MNAEFSWQVPSDLEQTYVSLREGLNPEAFTSIEQFFSSKPEKLAHFHFTLRNSVFVSTEISQRPWIFAKLITSDLLDATLSYSDFEKFVSIDNIADEKDLDRMLRQARAGAMIRIIWRDFNRLASFNETTDDLSHLAKACINAALNFHYRALETKHGTPRCKDGDKQPLLILGMGKLGANELNLSSDIDLIFTFPENGVTDGKRDLSNHEFFSRLGKKIIQSLDAITADGMVFRVDMRLRPYGQSGSLVYGFDALEEYYHTQGREWERYAMVKASVVANNGEKVYTERLAAMLREFTFRKYIDFSVIDALRGLKKMITQEVKRRHLEEDVKLGAGGIREIEFTAQVFQLIRGGRETSLQDNRLLAILPVLGSLRCLPPETVETLTDAYIFLRNTEHGIQGYNDEQTQKLPHKPEAQTALASVMGFDDWASFYETLEQHRTHVKAVFADLIAEPEEQTPNGDTENPCISLWHQRLGKDSAIAQLTEYGHEDANLSYTLLNELETWASNSAMHSSSRERLDAFIPALLVKLSDRDHPTETLRRFIQLIKATARRSAYILLLLENPSALSRLIDLSEASPWIADTMAEHPALLDELLDPAQLYHPPLKNELESELQRSTLRIAEDDLETQMDNLRYFRSSHALRVAASEITGVLPLMKVSDYLTWIAEVILEYVLILSWRNLVEKHGYPDGEARDIPNFVIAGYGKLGGIELGHGSDLDLVFIHGAQLNGVTDGERSIDNQTFYMRLGQKIIHFITTNMPSGTLYEVDMRLRPSGNSGMLVTGISAFEKYQHSSAWTWEHQALVRARVVAGDAELAKEFNRIRAEICCKEREDGTLRKEVIDMRNKMREHLGSKNGGEENPNEKFHIKHDAGGIVDIEFMVQYGVLAWGHSHPALVEYTDNIRILESFANSKLLEAHEVDQLTEAYKAFRTAGHRLTLQQQPSLIGSELLKQERQNVTAIWQRLMQDSSAH
ncbi:MAG: bifunctional [glutamate--ammonia ligase]-adenylyl-L-tyrosine phosphorylase/[glutamate--ammonia-ligase] adenylyltransferase [Agarilytica sp.]